MDETILVIDDNPAGTRLVRALLEGRYQVVDAPSAELGIAAARERRPSCIVMDIRLPGMDGIEATRLIRRDPGLRDIPVVALTAYDDAGEREALDAGCDAFLTKPIDVARFRECIGRFLRNARRPAGNLEAALRSRPRVLLVAADGTAASALEAGLTREGYDRLVAYDRKEALRLAETDRPDLVLLDVHVAGGDGFEVTRLLKRNLKTMHIPVVLITSRDDVAERIRGLEAGADELLTEPLHPAELLVRVQSILRLARVEEELAARRRAEAEAASGGPEGPGDGWEPAGVVIAGDTPGAHRVSDLIRAGKHRVLSVRGPEEAEAATADEGIDLAVFDISVDTGLALEVCRRIKDRHGHLLPLIALCNPKDPIERMRALEAGADEVLHAGVDSRELNLRLDHLLSRRRYLRRLHGRFLGAQTAAATDGLTGLRNASYFRSFLDLEIKRSARMEQPVALLMLDIDDFKAKNDTYGHPAGDRILAEMGEILRACVREIDVAARYGGEEFALVLPHTDLDGALVVADRVRSAVGSHPFADGAERIRVTVSIGGAICPTHGSEPGALVKAADATLYRAKREGKDRVCLVP